MSLIPAANSTAEEGRKTHAGDRSSVFDQNWLFSYMYTEEFGENVRVGRLNARDVHPDEARTLTARKETKAPNVFMLA